LVVEDDRLVEASDDVLGPASVGHHGDEFADELLVLAGSDAQDLGAALRASEVGELGVGDFTVKLHDVAGMDGGVENLGEELVGE